MKTYTTRFFLILVLCWTAAVFGQDDIDITRHPGYVDLGEIKIPDTKGEIVDISIGPELLRLVQDLDGEHDSSDSFDLKGCLNIQVKSFPLNLDEIEKIRPIVEKIDKKLVDENWKHLVRVKSEDEQVIVRIKKDKNNKMAGLIVMVLDIDSHEFAVINLVGDIDLDKVRKMDLMRNVPDSALDSLKNSAKR